MPHTRRKSTKVGRKKTYGVEREKKKHCKEKKKEREKTTWNHQIATQEEINFQRNEEREGH